MILIINSPHVKIVSKSQTNGSSKRNNKELKVIKVIKRATI